MADYDDGDVAYWVWRSGGNPDLVDRDRVDTYRDMGYTEDDAGRAELRRQRRRDSEERGDDERGW